MKMVYQYWNAQRAEPRAAALLYYRCFFGDATIKLISVETNFLN